MATATATTARLQNGTATVPASKLNPAPAARPYKDFLTPSLHRRFTTSALLVLAFCWVCSALIAFGTGTGFFWSLFPLFSFTGLRTLLLFVPCLAVFVVRVMNMHIGKRTTTSDVETVVGLIMPGGGNLGRTIGTTWWYVFSAWFFAEVYVWSKGADGYLSWIDPGREYERARVNENPFFLRSLLVFLAVVRTVTHLSRDVDRLAVEEEQEQKEADDWTAPLVKLGWQVQPMLLRALPSAVMALVYYVPIYFGFSRPMFWPYASAMARAVHRNLLPDKRAPGFIHPTTLAWQSLTSSVMLIMLWDVSNAIFATYVAQPPLKKGQPLTSEIKDARGSILSKSKDPNGSLIRGLNAKREVPKSFALWELYLICTTETFRSRRKTIYTEVDRKPESSWTQISKHCLNEIAAISKRIKTAQGPVEQSKKSADLQLQKQQEVLGLPKIADRPAMDSTDMFQKRSQPNRVNAVGNLAKNIGQQPAAVNPLTPHAKRAIAWTEQHTGGKDAWTRDGIEKGVQGKFIEFLKTPFGTPFRQTFARRVNAVIFGGPYSDHINVAHAIKSLTTLATASLKDDDFGQVAKDIPSIIRALTATIVDIKQFITSLEPTWTDVYFNEAHRNNIDEVRDVEEVLKKGLEEVILAFGEYASALGLSKKEMREAKEAVGKREEMKEV